MLRFCRRYGPVAETMPRSLRIDPDLWKAAVEKSRREGTTVTAVVERALRRYVGKGSA